MDYYEYTYVMQESLEGILSVISAAGWILGLVGYVLSSLGLYTIANRRCISKSWLAWVPVVRLWILGSISDQYRYVTKGQVKSKRKLLIALEAIGLVLSLVFLVVWGKGLFRLLGMLMYGQESQALQTLLALLPSVLGFALLSLVLKLVKTVVYYMAMYDLFTSVNPPYSVIFLVLSILFNAAEPFFVFFNRNKDAGMPPRCDIPVEPISISPEL